MIAKNYFDGTFRFDALTTFPFYMFLYHLNNHIRYVYLIKIIRLYKNFRIFQVPAIMKIVKKYEKNRLEKLVTPDPNHPEIKGLLAD